MLATTSVSGRTSPLRVETSMREGSLPSQYEASNTQIYDEQVRRISMAGLSGHSPISITNYSRFDDHVVDIANHKRSAERLNREEKEAILEINGVDTNS